MKAITVIPRRPDSSTLRDVPEPQLGPDDRRVKVKVLRVGLDGTDREINAGEDGAPGAHVAGWKANPRWWTRARSRR